MFLPLLMEFFWYISYLTYVPTDSEHWTLSLKLDSTLDLWNSNMVHGVPSDRDIIPITLRKLSPSAHGS
jgi:hypothetical protein